MIAPQPAPSAILRRIGRPRRTRVGLAASRFAGRTARMAPRPSRWEIFFDDRRAIRLKWGLLALLLLVAALLDVPL